MTAERVGNCGRAMRCAFVLAAVVLSPLTAGAQGVPGSPAGRRLRAFLQAGGVFYSGDFSVDDELRVFVAQKSNGAWVAPTLAVDAAWDLNPRIALTARVGVVWPLATQITLIGQPGVCPEDYALAYPDRTGGLSHDTTSTSAQASVGVRFRPVSPWGRFYLGAGGFAMVAFGDQNGPFYGRCERYNGVGMSDIPVNRPGDRGFSGGGAGLSLETGVYLGARQEFQLGFNAAMGADLAAGSGIGALAVLFGWSPL